MTRSTIAAMWWALRVCNRVAVEHGSGPLGTGGRKIKSKEIRGEQLRLSDDVKTALVPDLACRITSDELIP